LRYGTGSALDFVPLSLPGSGRRGLGLADQHHQEAGRGFNRRYTYPVQEVFYNNHLGYLFRITCLQIISMAVFRLQKSINQDTIPHIRTHIRALHPEKMKKNTPVLLYYDDRLPFATQERQDQGKILAQMAGQ
jgi:hypothetical protein